jgi:hypothetical protein
MREALQAALCVLTACFFPAVAAEAQTRATSSQASRLVVAQCPGPSPCNTSGITFTRGDVWLDKVKQPGPVFTSLVGRVSLRGVIPPQDNLDVVVSAKISYGPDPNANCPLANTQAVVSPWATSTLVCTPSGFGFYTLCRGQLNLVSLVSPVCSDVDIIIEDLRTEVYESGFVGDPGRIIARDGHAVSGRSPDCDSGGGGGCP